LLYLIPAVVVGLIFFFLFKKPGTIGHDEHRGPVIQVTTENTVECGENTFRLKGFKYIKPLVNEDRECESSRYAPLKENLKNFIEDQTRVGNIVCASVYLKNLGPGEDWIAVYPKLEYHPASLGKVPILITYLKKSESNPGFLDREIFYARDSKQIPPQTLLLTA